MVLKVPARGRKFVVDPRVSGLLCSWFFVFSKGLNANCDKLCFEGRNCFVRICEMLVVELKVACSTMSNR